MTSEIIIGLLLGVALSACCGFRVFIPLLVGSIAAKFGWIPLSENFAWLGSWAAIIGFGVAAVIEALAYYIPFVDNLLDTIAAPTAVAAGALMSASTMLHIDPTMQWILGLIVGGGTAGVVHAGTSLLRLGSTKFTAGTANPIVNTAEIGTSLVGSVMAILMPIVVGLIAIIVVGFSIYLIGKRFMKTKVA
jgi:hypothetical protein